MSGSYKILHVQTQLTWENAKEGCKDKFVGPDGGRLFEPMTLAENKLVYDVAKAILNLQHLIRCSSDQILNLHMDTNIGGSFNLIEMKKGRKMPI